MNFLFFIILIALLNSCSFDNKTGIWENENKPLPSKNKIYKDFKTISTSQNFFNETIVLKKNYNLDFSSPETNLNWTDILYAPNNNFKNFNYNNLNKVLFKSKKISKYKVGKYKLFENDNLIISDERGNLLIFSFNENKIVRKFNFYKKKFRKIEKIINYAVENNIIYVGDNLGYLYAYNYISDKILWAKDYKIPFNSNLKIFQDKIIISNQNNDLNILKKSTGDLLKSIPTEEFFIKNKFKNNLSINNKGDVIFLNSFGSLYSVNLSSMKINWFNNFNQSFDFSSSNYFMGNQVINSDKVIVISSNKDTYLIDVKTGSVIKKFNFSSEIKPIIIKKNLIILSKNNFLINIDLDTKNIIYSYDISKEKKIKSNILNSNIFKEILILNSEIFIFLADSSILVFNMDGNFKKTIKLPRKLNSFPIIQQDSILYLDNKNKLIIFD